MFQRNRLFKKPHLGILTNLNGRKYVIPLTSAKPKHAVWRDITPTNYGVMVISTSKDFKDIAGIAKIKVDNASLSACAELRELKGILPLFFRYEGTGTIDFTGFKLKNTLFLNSV